MFTWLWERIAKSNSLKVFKSLLHIILKILILGLLLLLLFCTGMELLFLGVYDCFSNSLLLNIFNCRPTPKVRYIPIIYSFFIYDNINFKIFINIKHLLSCFFIVYMFYFLGQFLFFKCIIELIRNSLTESV